MVRRYLVSSAVHRGRNGLTGIIDDLVEKNAIFVEIAEQLFGRFGVGDRCVVFALHSHFFLLRCSHVPHRLLLFLQRSREGSEQSRDNAKKKEIKRCSVSSLSQDKSNKRRFKRGEITFLDSSCERACKCARGHSERKTLPRRSYRRSKDRRSLRASHDSDLDQTRSAYRSGRRVTGFSHLQRNCRWPPELC